MGSRIECFWLEPIDSAAESLRRYRLSEECPCPARIRCHNAEVRIGIVPFVSEWAGTRYDDLDHADERWPKKCDACDYVFTDSDSWQHVLERLYQPSNGGPPIELRSAPPGAMWNATWLAEFDDYRHADGRSLVLKTPGGQWAIDGPASNGRWTRTGDPPKITVQGSIAHHELKDDDGRIISPGYHGILTDGVLTEC